MNKILRFSLLSLLSLMSSLTFAETIIWSEDWSAAKKDQTPTEVNANYDFTDGGSKTKIYTEALAGGTSPELLVGKKGTDQAGAFSAKINLNGITGDMTLRFLTNKKLDITSPTTGVTVGELKASGNSKDVAITVASNVTEIVIVFTNNSSNNARLDNIKLFQGVAKNPAGLSWGTASRSVTIGASDNEFPTLTNENNLSVTYQSSDEKVATIASDGTITLHAAGTTTISAIFAGNDQYEAQTVSYELTVNAAVPTTGKGTESDPYTVAEALALDQNSLPTYSVYISGTISQIKEVSTQYHNATYYISDDGTTTSQLKVYRGKYLGNKDFTATDQIKVGDKVVVVGKLIVYSGELEVNSGNYLHSLNGTTKINFIVTDEDGDAPAFNAAGQRVSSSYKGLIIRNGRKFVRK